MGQNQSNCYAAPEWLTCLIQIVIGLLIVTFTSNADNFTNLFDVNGEAVITVIADLIVKKKPFDFSRMTRKQAKWNRNRRRKVKWPEELCCCWHSWWTRRTKELKEEPLVLGSRHKGRGRLGSKFFFLVDLYWACRDQKQNKIVMHVNHHLNRDRSCTKGSLFCYLVILRCSEAS